MTFDYQSQWGRLFVFNLKNEERVKSESLLSKTTKLAGVKMQLPYIHTYIYIYTYIFIHTYIYRAFCYQIDKLCRMIVNMKINIIK